MHSLRLRHFPFLVELKPGGNSRGWWIFSAPCRSGRPILPQAPGGAFVGTGFCSVGGVPTKEITLLADAQIRRARPTEKSSRMPGGCGLNLQLDAGSSKLWRMKHRYAGKATLHSFGEYPEAALALACDKARCRLRAVACRPPSVRDERGARHRGYDRCRQGVQGRSSANGTRPTAGSGRKEAPELGEACRGPQCVVCPIRACAQASPLACEGLGI
jgi:hypothetical protein